MGLVARTAVCVDRLPAPHMYDTPILLQDPFHAGGSAAIFVPAIITQIGAAELQVSPLRAYISVIFQVG